jgi:hypothetical protein
MRLGLGLGLGHADAAARRQNSEDDVPTRYLFIDGNFFSLFVKEMKSLALPEIGEVEIDLDRVGAGYDRIFFYDAFPEQLPGQSEEAFRSVTEVVKKKFEQISRTRNFNVRPALTRRGKSQQQKGVDVMLAIECLQHAIKNNIDEATVMASDLDFYPLFEALLQTKTRSTLLYRLDKTSPELVQAADHAVALTYVTFQSWVRRIDLKDPGRYSSHAVNDNMNAKSDHVKSGTIAEKPLELRRHDGEFFMVVDGSHRSSACKSQLWVEAVTEGHFRSTIKYDDEN